MLTIVNKMVRKEVYILSGNVENHRTILTLFYILYSTTTSICLKTKSLIQCSAYLQIKQD